MTIQMNLHQLHPHLHHLQFIHRQLTSTTLPPYPTYVGALSFLLLTIPPCYPTIDPSTITSKPSWWINANGTLLSVVCCTIVVFIPSVRFLLSHHPPSQFTPWAPALDFVTGGPATPDAALQSYALLRKKMWMMLLSKCLAFRLLHILFKNILLTHPIKTLITHITTVQLIIPYTMPSHILHTTAGYQLSYTRSMIIPLLLTTTIRTICNHPLFVLSPPLQLA